jgi:DNA polymerase/3'-5' exonuclease PolX
MENIEIAAILSEMATLLEIQGETNPFRIRAYRNAVYTIQESPDPIRKMVEEGADLTELPAIGKDMASHITELVTTGRLSILEDISKEVPRSLVQLTKLPGVGPKKVRKLWDELDITTLEQLAEIGRRARAAADRVHARGPAGRAPGSGGELPAPPGDRRGHRPPGNRIRRGSRDGALHLLPAGAVGREDR